MHQLIEGLSGVEVVAGDFVIVGFGDNEVDAHRNYDANVLAFVQRCEQSGVKLNANKMELRIPVPFIGHVATADGLRVDPRKVRAINAETDRCSCGSASARANPVFGEIPPTFV